MNRPKVVAIGMAAASLLALAACNQPPAQIAANTQLAADLGLCAVAVAPAVQGVVVAGGSNATKAINSGTAAAQTAAQSDACKKIVADVTEAIKAGQISGPAVVAAAVAASAASVPVPLAAAPAVPAAQ